MAISSSSTAVASTRRDKTTCRPTFATSTSLIKCSSSHRSRSQTIINSIIQSGHSIGLPFCAEAMSDHSSRVKISRIEQQDSTTLHRFDVTSARGWMEDIERREGEFHGIGAYTVLRCDAVYTKNKCRWKIWGLDFHMHRLGSSFRTLMKNVSLETFDSYTGDAWEHESTRRTDDLINALLNDAAMYLLNVETTVESHDSNHGIEEDVRIRTLMLTVLWSPTVMDDKMTIIRGHATFAGTTRVLNPNGESPPLPISVCLAIPSDPSAEALSLLPRRHLDDKRFHSSPAQSVGSNAKVSSWCRNRRPLEVLFKDSGVGEVLLMGLGENAATVGGQGFVDSLEILEGLISNLFVIYKDGTVRTAPTTKVLSGYARHLVLGQINQTRGLRLDDQNAPVVGDADDWSEVFLTSAIRLIVPVNRVLIPPVGGRQSMTLWESQHDNGSNKFTDLLWSGIQKHAKYLF
jgi:hypothetical protein